MKNKAFAWTCGFLVYAVLILVIMFNVVGPALHMGSAAFHLAWPLIIIGFLFTVTRKPIADIWS